MPIAKHLKYVVPEVRRDGSGGRPSRPFGDGRYSTYNVIKVLSIVLIFIIQAYSLPILLKCYLQFLPL